MVDGGLQLPSIGSKGDIGDEKVIIQETTGLPGAEQKVAADGLLNGLLNGVTDVLTDVLNETTGVVTDVLNETAGAVTEVVNETTGVVTEVVNETTDGLTETLDEILNVSLARVMGPPDCQGDGTTVARY
ncbi:hypothetical protein MHAS44199_10920 [Mycolicibacterium hassiacum DSM 44199]|nr:hypothetical protein [Mycolicibacterium hassiacum DSM 44199]